MSKATLALVRTEAVPPPAAVPRRRVVREHMAACVTYAELAVHRIGWAGVVGLALLVFALGLLFATNAPLRRQAAELERELDVAQATAASERRLRVAADPGARLARFRAGLPRQSDLPQVIGRMLREADAAGVELERGTYEFRAGDSGLIARYTVTLPVQATYPQIRAMTGVILAALPAVALESLRIERDGVSDEVVTADLRFAVFVRGDP